MKFSNNNLIIKPKCRRNPKIYSIQGMMPVVTPQPPHPCAHMCLCTCIHICMYLWTYTHKHTHMYIHISSWMYTHTSTHTYTQTHKDRSQQTRVGSQCNTTDVTGGKGQDKKKKTWMYMGNATTRLTHRVTAMSNSGMQRWQSLQSSRTPRPKARREPQPHGCSAFRSPAFRIGKKLLYFI